MCAFGAYVAYIIEDRHKVVVNGVLSSAVLYLIYLAFLSPRKIISESIEVKLEFPKDIKYLVIGFFATMIMFWAAGQILDLIWYLLSGFTGE